VADGSIPRNLHGQIAANRGLNAIASADLTFGTQHF
jgi:hypothetical protein